MVKVLCKGGPYYWIKEPYTDEERRAFDSTDNADWPKGYSWNHFLLPAEIYPRDETDPPDPFDKALNDVKHITFYGGAPHRPSPPSSIERAPARRRRKQR
jgi:hypothetical protein